MVDPAVAKCAKITEVVAEATTVPESSREMLSMMATSSLMTYADVRHSYQAKVVEMVGEALTGMETAMTSELETAKTELGNSAGEKAGRAAALAEAEAKYKELQEATQAKKAGLEEAETAEAEGLTALAAAEKAVKSLEPETKKAIKSMNAATKALAALRDGPKAFFTELEARQTPPPEPEEPP